MPTVIQLMVVLVVLVARAGVRETWSKLGRAGEKWGEVGRSGEKWGALIVVVHFEMQRQVGT